MSLAAGVELPVPQPASTMMSTSISARIRNFLILLLLLSCFSFFILRLGILRPRRKPSIP